MYLKSSFTALAMLLASLTITAQTNLWIDVTDTYIKNPRFDNNNYSNWSGTAFAGYNPKENAEHYSKTYDTWQQLSGLEPGHYRLSLQAFYRMGNSSNDYSLYSSGKYASSQNAQLYYSTSTKNGSVAIVPASSGAVAASLGGSASGVGTPTWGWGGQVYPLYIPNDMQAAYYWFNAGYYNNSIELDVPADGSLKIGVSKTKLIAEDWTCLDNWKLEKQITTAAAKAGNLIINELMAANVDVYRDRSTNFGSWVEVYNASEDIIALDGLYISDDPANLRKHRLPDGYGFVQAHGFAVLEFDHYEVWSKNSLRQIDDKLDCDGGTIIISNGTDIISQVDYPAAISRVSYARTTDGGETWGTSGSPSPGKSNMTNGGGFATMQIAAPVIDTDSKLFKNSFNIKVTIPAGCTLRYTTDGTTPTLTNGSTSSTGAFTISNYSTSYRFRLFKSGMLPSNVTTRTYIKDGGKYCFPIISIVADRKDIFDGANAIFATSDNGKPGNGRTDNYNANMDWDRPVSFEYITEDGKSVINQECDYSACGGWSRSWSPHSFKLKASKAYEMKNSFDYRFFSEKPFLKHKTLQIRNGGNDNNCRIKDAAVQGIVASSGLYIDHQAWQPVHVFYNGTYYDVLNMREPNNKHYAYANYGIDTDLMDQFEINPDSGYVQMEGTEEAFLRVHELSAKATDATAYSEICKLVDIDEFINYMAVQLYIGSNDWPHNNLKGFRSTEDGKFHFVLFDVDFALATTDTFNWFANHKTYTSDNALHGYDWSRNVSIEGIRPTHELKIVSVFLNLLNNDSFRKQFVDAFCLVSGSVFEPTRVKEVVNKMASYLGTNNWVTPTNSANEIMNGFNSTRQKTMINNMKAFSRMKLSNVSSVTMKLSSNIADGKILVNGQEVPTGKFNGQLFYPITVMAVAPAGYKFVGWKDTSNQLRSQNAEFEIPKASSYPIVATWEKMTEEEMIAAGIATPPVVINEISAGNTMYVNDYIKKDDWIELYNTTDKAIDVAGYYLSDNEAKPTKYEIASTGGAASTTIPAHGYLIVWASKREDMGKDIHASFKLGNTDGSVIMLTAPDKSWSDTMKYDAHDGMESVGRFPDASTDIYKFSAPTIGKANTLTLTSPFAYSDFVATAILSPVVDEAGADSNRVYNLNGQQVNSSYRGIIIRNGKKLFNSRK